MLPQSCSREENTSGVNITVVDSKQKQKQQTTSNQIKHRNSSLSLREIDEIEIRYIEWYV